MISPNAIQQAITGIVEHLKETPLWEFLESNYSSQLTYEEAVEAMILVCKGVAKELNEDLAKDMVDEFYEELE